MIGDDAFHQPPAAVCWSTSLECVADKPVSPAFLRKGTAVMLPPTLCSLWEDPLPHPPADVPAARRHGRRALRCRPISRPIGMIA